MQSYAHLCINMCISFVFRTVTPHGLPVLAHPSKCIRLSASARVHPHKLRVRKNRLSTPCGVSSRFIICRIRSVDMHRIIPRILYASSS